LFSFQRTTTSRLLPRFLHEFANILLISSRGLVKITSPPTGDRSTTR
jgi:hypothetical protein